MKQFVTVIFVFLFVWAFMPTDVARAANLPAAFPAFSSVNLDGISVTDDIFAKEKLTVINIWATWCPPCVGEMPDLGNMGRSMPEGSQLAGLVLDVQGPGDSKTISAAKNILSQSSADFIQFLPTREMILVLEFVESIPTTIFVDSAGKILGEPLIGARSEEAYRTEIEKILKTVQ